MTIYLVYTFDDPTHLARITTKLAPSRVIVHVDAKVDIAPFLASVRVAGTSEAVTFIRDRVVVNWAGYSQVRAIRKMVHHALDMAVRPDEYIVMLSGSDYPLRSSEQIDIFFQNSAGRQYLRAFAIEESSAHYRNQIDRLHFYDLPLLASRATRPNAKRIRFALISGLEAISAFGPRREAPRELTVAHGGTHFALTASALADLESRVTTDVERFFRFTFCPEEKFYHSLLASSQYLRQTPTGALEPFTGRGQWRYANLHHIDPTLTKVYTYTDWPEVELAAKTKLFLRKLRTVPSSELLNAIDTKLLTPGPLPPLTDGSRAG